MEGSTKNEDDRQNVNIGIDNVTSMVEELTNYLGTKPSYLIRQQKSRAGPSVHRSASGAPLQK